MTRNSVFLIGLSVFVFSVATKGAELEGRLDFLPGGGYNELALTVTIGDLSDSDTTQVTGEAEVRLELDEESGAPLSLEFTGGRIFFSDTSFVFRVFFTQVGNASGTNLSGMILTPEAPAAVEPSGSFDAALHEVRIDAGTVQGSMAGVPFEHDFSEDPVSGRGSGTGAVSLVRTGTGWDVEIELPVNIDQTTGEGGFAASGVLKASGAFDAPSGGFGEWVDSLDPPLADHRRGLLDRNGRLDLPNLLFYVTGIHPFSGQDPRPELVFREDPEGAWVVTHVRRRDLPDAQLRLSGNPSPAGSGPWLAPPVLSETVTPLDETTEEVEIVLDLPAETARYFIRLEASIEQ